MELLKTFNVKKVENKLDEESKEEYVLLYLDTKSPDIVNTQSVILQEYTTQIRKN